MKSSPIVVALTTVACDPGFNVDVKLVDSMGSWQSAVMRFGLCLLVGCLLSGCASAQDLVVKQASFDHDCPEDKVHVLSEDRDTWSYKLDVCGQKRKYRDFGNEKEFQFVDVTDRTKLPAKLY